MILQCLKQSNRFDRVLNCISFAVIAVAFAFLVTLIYWNTFPYNPLEIKKKPLPVLAKEIRQGGMLNYELDYCKNSSLPVHIGRKFIDGVVWSLPGVVAQNEPGCRKIVVAVEVPHTLPPGNYKFEADYEYRVNPIRTVVVTAFTEPFTIIARDSK